MEHSAKAYWEKVKDAGEFTAGIVAIVAVLYGLSWLADDILGHTHIHIDHRWWAYKVWHAWWWLISPLGLVTMGRAWHQRALGQGMWAVGVIWLAFLAFGACIGWWLSLLIYLAARFGWLAGGALSLAAMVPFTFAGVLVGILVDQARERSHLFDRLVTEICWMPDSKAKPELSRDVP